MEFEEAKKIIEQERQDRATNAMNEIQEVLRKYNCQLIIKPEITINGIPLELLIKAM
jgi:hypothetical protein